MKTIKTRAWRTSLNHSGTGINPDGETEFWGRKYTMLGLLYYFDLSGDAEALYSAEGLADHLMTAADQ